MENIILILPNGNRLAIRANPVGRGSASRTTGHSALTLDLPQNGLANKPSFEEEDDGSTDDGLQTLVETVTLLPLSLECRPITIYLDDKGQPPWHEARVLPL
jgi:hypothetical protein